MSLLTVPQLPTRRLGAIAVMVIVTLMMAAAAPTAAAAELGRPLDRLHLDLAVQCGADGQLADLNCIPRCEDGPRRSCHSDDTCPDGTVLVESECLVYCSNDENPQDHDCYEIPPECAPGFELLEDGLCHPLCEPGTARVGLRCVSILCPTPHSCFILDPVSVVKTAHR